MPLLSVKATDFINKAQTKIRSLATNLAEGFDYNGYQSPDAEKDLMMIYEFRNFVRQLLLPGYGGLTDKQVSDLIEFFIGWGNLTDIEVVTYSSYTSIIEELIQVPAGTYALQSDLLNEVGSRQVADLSLSDRITYLETHQIDPGTIFPDHFFDNVVSTYAAVFDDDARLHTHANMTQLNAITAQMITDLMALQAHLLDINTPGAMHVTAVERTFWNSKLGPAALDALAAIYAPIAHVGAGPDKHTIAQITNLQTVIDALNTDIAAMAGIDGREVELNSPDGDLIQWRFVGDPTWIDLGHFKGDQGDQGDPFTIGARGGETGRLDHIYDAETANFAYLAEDTGYLFFRYPPGGPANMPAGWSTGLKFLGDNGWSPVLGIYDMSPSRAVYELLDWIGGSGSKPVLDPGIGAPIPVRWFLGSGGFTLDAALAINIRGPQGATGPGPIISATGNLAGRAAYDSRPAGFMYLRTDVSPQGIYIKASDTPADWTPLLTWQGPIGPAGPPAPMLIGAVVTGGTPGSVLYVTTGPVLGQDPTAFFYDDTNKRLGIGTNTPTTALHVLRNQNAATRITTENTTPGGSSYTGYAALSDTGFFSFYVPSSTYGVTAIQNQTILQASHKIFFYTGATNESGQIGTTGVWGFGSAFTPGTLNSTSFGGVRSHIYSTGQALFAIDGAANTGILLNDQSRSANQRLWQISLNTSKLLLSTVTDAGIPTTAAAFTYTYAFNQTALDLQTNGSLYFGTAYKFSMNSGVVTFDGGGSYPVSYRFNTSSTLGLFIDASGNVTVPNSYLRVGPYVEISGTASRINLFGGGPGVSLDIYNNSNNNYLFSFNDATQPGPGYGNQSKYPLSIYQNGTDAVNTGTQRSSRDFNLTTSLWNGATETKGWFSWKSDASTTVNLSQSLGLYVNTGSFPSFGTKIASFTSGGVVGFGTGFTPGTINGNVNTGTKFHVYSTGNASNVIDAGNYPGLIFNDQSQSANNRLWILYNDSATNKFTFSTYDDLFNPTVRLSIARTGELTSWGGYLDVQPAGLSLLAGATAALQSSTGNGTVTLSTNAGRIISNGSFEVNQDSRAASWRPSLSVTPGTHTGMTATTEFPDNIFFGSTKTWAAAGAAFTQRFNWFKGSTVATATAADAYTVSIDAPTGGLTNWALGLNGKLRFVTSPTNDNAQIQLLTVDGTTGEVKYRTVASLPGGSGWAVTGNTTITGDTSQTGAFKNSFNLNSVEVIQNALSAGSVSSALYILGGNLTSIATAGVPSSLYVQPSTFQYVTGAISSIKGLGITLQNATIAFVGASTITDVASVYLYGSVIAGTNATITNSHGLYIGATGQGTNTYGITANASTAGTNNWSAQFLGGFGVKFAQAILSSTHTFIDFVQSAHTGGIPTGIKYTGGAHTTLSANQEVIDIQFNLARTMQWANGAIGTQRSIVINAPTYSHVSGSNTITDAATVAITGNPGTAAGFTTLTRSHGLLIQGGSYSGQNVSNAIGLTVNSPTLSGQNIVVSFNQNSGGANYLYRIREITANNFIHDITFGTGTGGGGGYAITQSVIAGTINATGFSYVGAAHTNITNTEAIDVRFNLARTVQFTGNTGFALNRAFVIDNPTYAFVSASGTITDAATLAIIGAPVAGTNAILTNTYAFYVQAGNSRFVGDIRLTGATRSFGTFDSNILQIMTNNVTRISFATTGAQTHTMTAQSSSATMFTMTTPVHTGGTQTIMSIVGGAYTGQATTVEMTDINFNLARTVTWATGGIITQRFFRIQAPTIAFAGASTVTDAATFEVGGAPAAGANATLTRSWAARFGGNVCISGSTYFGSITVAPLSTVDIGGSIGVQISSISATTTLDATYHTVKCDATSAAFIVNLPAASGCTRRVYVVIKIDSTANAITIDANASETISGNLTKLISTQWSGYAIQSDGTNWVIIATF